MKFSTLALLGIMALVARPTYATVTITGLTEPLEKNARSLIRLASTPCDAAPWRVERLYQNMDKQLSDAMRALGHYQFEFDKTLSFDNSACWSATLEVTPGDPVLLRKVDVNITGEARSDAAVVARIDVRKPVPDTVLNHGQYETYKQFVMSMLRARGYFEAQLVENAVVVDETLSFADIQLQVSSGPRYIFGPIEFGEPVLDRDLLLGYADFSPGDAYDDVVIAKLYESLNGSGYFGSVSIRTEPATDGSHEVPVFISLTPGIRRVYTTGVGYATDIGLQGRLGYTNRRRNSKGHMFDSQLFMSRVNSELTGTYRWPRGNPNKEWVGLFGGFQRKRTETSDSDTVTLGARLAYNRGENWLESPYVNLTNEDFKIGDQVDSTRLVTPGINWESTVGREIKRMRSGRRINLQIKGAHENLGSDTSFLQLTASAKWVTSFSDANRLLARVDLGYTAKTDVEDLPATVRFFAGGDNSVRGYDFETIGPVDANGAVTGGNNLAVFSVEFDRLIAKSWSLAAFIDTGSAFNDFDVDFQTGAGLGIRWYSPLGPIRLDVAHPIGESDRSTRLHITLGTDL
jgi:translocation and assembly module TamA